MTLACDPNQKLYCVYCSIGPQPVPDERRRHTRTQIQAPHVYYPVPSAQMLLLPRIAHTPIFSYHN